MKKINITALLLALTFTAGAQGTTSQPVATFHGILLGIIFVLTIVLVMVVFTLQKAVNVIKAENEGTKKYEDDRTGWEKLLSLKPLAAEKDIELEHDYDGIKELNNPIPPWFNVLFYGTVVFAIVYLLIYHVAYMAPLQGKEYENELALADQQKQEYLKKAGNLIDENSVTLLTEKTKIDAGLATFTARCAACHGEKGEGKVGPNLTDEFWIHGGGIKNVFKTIKYGVPAKGMVAWQNTLNAAQIQEVASYILSLQGTNPPGAKEPQGEKYLPDGAAAAAPDTSQTDTTKN
ncbi:MAG: c-type cytochrome [Bacteroidia bacterium]|nr:c-type cytochrome [Bacteroidia bacterium]